MTLLLAGCSRESAPPTGADGRIVVEYWEKWTGFEGDAIQQIVDDFNASQDRIFVNKVTVSKLDQKLLLATAGGNPPDVAGLWSYVLPDFASRGGLVPLDKFAAEAGISRDDYVPVFYDLGTYHGFLWALPSTPATTALHWNRALFRDAGLDPDQPPRSLAELEAMSDRLTIVAVERDGRLQQVPFLKLTPAERQARDFNLVRVGHLPQEPGWWLPLWVFWFNGSHLTDDEIDFHSPEMIAAYEWYDRQVDKFGVENLRSFRAGFGNFASPQNPFLSGRVAMCIQGVWLHNFIEKFAPDLEWDAAPFPSVDPEALPGVTVAETDQFVIPRGARHPRAAFEFIRYVNTPAVMRKLNLAQRKFSPLLDDGPDFAAAHANPHVQTFIDLARSPNARIVPRIPVWTQVETELRVAADKVFNRLATPEEALTTAERRSRDALTRSRQIWDRVRDERLAQWSDYDPR